MADVPTQEELFEEFKAQVLGDSSTQLDAFYTGSGLYTLAQVAATMGRAVVRWFVADLRAAFFSTAEGGDLDYLVTDVLGDALQRQQGETDEEYLTRIYAYIDSLIRGTPPAFDFWLKEYDGRASEVRVEEDVQAAVTDIYVTPKSTVNDVSAYLDELRSELDAWRTFNGSVNILEETS